MFNRVTGEPLWPIKERAVPRSDMPGEETWPTQPFPLKPPPFARQTFTEKDLRVPGAGLSGARIRGSEYRYRLCKSHGRALWWSIVSLLTFRFAQEQWHVNWNT